MSSSDRLATMLKVQRTLHAALLGSIGIYVVVAHFVTTQPASGPRSELAIAIAEEPLSSPLFLALAGLAALTAAALPTLRPRLLPPRQAAASLSDDIGDPSSPAASRALTKLHSAHIFTWAMCESMAIYGLVLALLSHELWPVLPFAALGALNMLAYAPRRALLDEVVRAANRA